MSTPRELAWQQIENVYRASVSRQFARYALGIDYAALPADVVHQAKRCVIDALGCAIGAYAAPGRIMCEETVREIGGAPEATVFCSGLRTSALNASLVNSFLVRFLDYNDLGGGGHNSDALASILAVAERGHANGKQFIESLVVSYELGARFRDAVTQTRATDESTLGNERHTEGPVLSATSLAGIANFRSLEDKGWGSDVRAGLNQPPALGKLMGLDEEQIANAIGICLSHAVPLGILDAHREECSMAKNIRFGWAAHDAILACMLAKRGFTGPIRVVEGSGGLSEIVAQGEMDLERLTDFSGWRMRDVRFKSVPANGPTGSHVTATLALVNENDLTPDDILAVRIIVAVRESKHTTTPAKKYPRNAESADHSAFYANALAIKERAFGPSSIDPAKFTDPVVLDLIEKITVEADPSFHGYKAVSEIDCRDGRRLRKAVNGPYGLGANAHSDAELEAKFRAMASTHMDERRIAQIFDCCWNLDQCDDVGTLAALMTFER